MTASTFGEASFTPALPNVLGEPRRAGAEFLRYFAASAAALGVDTVIYLALISAGAEWSLAAAAGFAFGLALAYGLSVRLVFKHRAMSNRRQEFIAFAAIGLVGLLLTEALLWLFLQRLQLPPLPAKLITAGVVFIGNFGLRRALLFTQRGGA